MFSSLLDRVPPVALLQPATVHCRRNLIASQLDALGGLTSCANAYLDGLRQAVTELAMAEVVALYDQAANAARGSTVVVLRSSQDLEAVVPEVRRPLREAAREM